MHLYSICQMQQTKDGLNHSVIHYFPLYPLLALNLIFTKRAVRAGVLELQIEGSTVNILIAKSTTFCVLILASLDLNLF